MKQKYRIRISSAGLILLLILSSLAVVGGEYQINPNSKPLENEYRLTCDEWENSVEDISMRSLTTKFFDNGDGTMTARIWAKPIHFENEAGKLVDFETDLRPLNDNEGAADGYDVGVMQNTLRAYFDYDYSDANPPVKYSSRDGHWLTWEPGAQQLIDLYALNSLKDWQLSTGPITGNVLFDSAPSAIIYGDTYSAVSEQYTVSTGFVKHDYIIDERTGFESEIYSGLIETRSNSDDLNNYGIGYSGTLGFSRNLIPYVDGNELSSYKLPLITGSPISFREYGSYEIKHFLPAPYAYEKENRINAVKSAYLVTNMDGNRIEISTVTELSWLLEPERNYPVVIDPSDDVYTINPGPTEGKDCFLASPAGSGSNEVLNFGSDQSMFLTLENSQRYVKLRPLVKFDINDIPLGKDIIYARMKINFYNDENNDQTAHTATVYPINRDWSEGTGTWNSPTRNGACWLYYDGTNAWNSQGGDHDTSVSSSTDLTTYGQHIWDVAEIFKNWYNGVKSNHGFLMKGTAGGDSLKYLYSSDHNIAIERPILEVKILTERPPIIVPGAPSLITVLEDSEPVYFDLYRIFEDPNEDELEFSVWLNGWSSGPYESENVTIAIETNDTLMIIPRENQYGTETIWLNANDTTAEIMHKLTVSILPVNDPPVLKTITDKKGSQGSWLNFTIKAIEVDEGQNQVLSYGTNVTEEVGIFTGALSVTKDPNNPSRAHVSFLPTNEHVGEFYVTFWVKDHLDQDNASVKFSIKNRNDPPVITDIKVSGEMQLRPVRKNLVNLIAIQDQVLNFTVIVDDPDMNTPDGDELNFWSNRTDENFVVDSETGKISFLPTSSDVGFYYTKIYVRDYDGAEDYVDIIIKVNNQPDPPKITGVQVGDKFFAEKDGEIELKGDDGAKQDHYFNFTVIVTDADLGVDAKEILKFRTNRSADFNFIIDSRSGEVTFRPEQEEVGIYVVRITVMDNDELENEVSVSIHVADVNDLPPAPELSVVSSDENLAINAIVTIPPIDPDGDFLVCIWDFGDGTEPEVKVDNEDKWTAVHTYLEPGVYLVNLTLDDGRGGLVIVSKIVTVGEIVDDDEVEPPVSLGTDKKSEDDSDLPLILGVLIIVIIVILVAFYLYMHSGKKLLEDEEDEEEDLLDSDFFIREMNLYPQQPVSGYGMYMGYPMGRGMMYSQQAMGMQQPTLPPIGMGVSPMSATQPPVQQPQLALPPGPQPNFCPQCGQQSIQYLSSDGSHYACTNCGYRV